MDFEIDFEHMQSDLKDFSEDECTGIIYRVRKSYGPSKRGFAFHTRFDKLVKKSCNCNSCQWYEESLEEFPPPDDSYINFNDQLMTDGQLCKLDPTDFETTYGELGEVEEYRPICFEMIPLFDEDGLPLK